MVSAGPNEEAVRIAASDYLRGNEQVPSEVLIALELPELGIRQQEPTVPGLAAEEGALQVSATHSRAVLGN